MTIKKNTSIKLGKKSAGNARLSGRDVDEALTLMEGDIRKLKIEYEQYFGGGRARPPADTEWRIEETIKRYGERGAEMSFGQRFRYNNLAQTYVKYAEIFRKRLRKREEGTVDRHFGAAARAIEAERAAAHAKEAPASGATPFVVRFVDPASDPRKVEEIYKAFRQALEHSGHSVESLSPHAFQGFLQDKLEQLRKQAGGQEVEVVVSVEKNKPVLKARLKS
jgi:hypothetical protein